MFNKKQQNVNNNNSLFFKIYSFELKHNEVKKIRV